MFSFLFNNFVDFTHSRRLHLLCQSQFSTSEEEAGIYGLSSSRPTDKQFYLAPLPWTCKYPSLQPLFSVPAFMLASKPSNPSPTEPLATSCGCIIIVSRVRGVRRGRILGLTLCEGSPENIPHLCQQDCICKHLNSQRASISLLIKIINWSIGKITLAMILAVLASLN